MLTLHRASDGAPIYISAALVASISPDLHPDNTEICAAGFPFIVRESPDEVARLVAEATRPAGAVDQEAVATARRVLLLLSDHADTMPTGDRDGFGRVIYNGLHLRDADWPDIAATLRALAARLGGAS